VCLWETLRELLHPIFSIPRRNIAFQASQQMQLNLNITAISQLAIASRQQPWFAQLQRKMRDRDGNAMINAD
jgi:hypothetical protein